MLAVWWSGTGVVCCSALCQWPLPCPPPAGVPGVVSPTVEPFTKDSVRITWDPPAEPNDDIELLSYNVYFEIRNFSEPRAFSIDVPNPDRTRAWNMRSVEVSGMTQQQFMVAYVVAVSTNGMYMVGAVASEESYGITYGTSECGVCVCMRGVSYIRL